MPQHEGDGGCDLAVVVQACWGGVGSDEVGGGADGAYEAGGVDGVDEACQDGGGGVPYLVAASWMGDGDQ